ncbi:MAG: hypothetical protein ACR2PA_13445 [Hyphomicrobiaceae bacterium]
MTAQTKADLDRLVGHHWERTATLSTAARHHVVGLADISRLSAMG